MTLICLYLFLQLHVPLHAKTVDHVLPLTPACALPGSKEHFARFVSSNNFLNLISTNMLGVFLKMR